MLTIRRMQSRGWCKQTKRPTVDVSQSAWEGWHGDENGPTFFVSDCPLFVAAEVYRRAAVLASGGKLGVVPMFAEVAKNGGEK